MMDRIQKLQTFLSERPDDSFLKHALAMEFIKSGDDARAQALLEELLQADPGYVGSYYQLAKLLERANDAEGAISVYERGIVEARKVGDQHAQRELQNACDNLRW